MKAGYIIKNIFGIFIVIQFISCNYRTQSFRTANLWLWNNNKYVKYSLKVPPKCSCLFHAEENSHEKQYMYSDSSYIFLASDINQGIFSQEILERYGRDLPVMFTSWLGTVQIQGTDTNCRFWRVIRKGRIVYGYKKVTAGNRPLFDSVMNSIVMHMPDKIPKEKPELYFIKGSLIGGDTLIKCKRF